MRNLLQSEKRLARAIDYQKTFQGEHGKRVLADLMDQAGMLRPNFDARNPDLNLTVFKEGMRNVCCMILAEINIDPYKLQQMVELERIQEQAKDAVT